MDSIVLIVVVIVVVLVLIFSYSKQQSAYVPMIYLCTKTEANLFRQLNKKLPEHYHLASKVHLVNNKAIHDYLFDHCSSNQREIHIA